MLRFPIWVWFLSLHVFGFHDILSLCQCLFLLSLRGVFPFFNQNLGFDCWVSFILVNGWISYLVFYFLFVSGFHGIGFFMLECKSGFIKK